jgi:hypothetical protein
MGPTSLERAFALADQGLSISYIRQTLKREGYDHYQIYGTVLRQLNMRAQAANEMNAQP